NNIYNQFNFTGLTSGQIWASLAANQTVASNKVKSFLCPAAPDGSSATWAGIAVDYGTAGTDFTPNLASYGNTHLGIGGATAAALGKTNYLPCMGDWRYGQGYNGAFYYNRPQKIVTITDGSSNTFMFGEFCGGSFGSGSPRSYFMSWMVNGDFTAFGV